MFIGKWIEVKDKLPNTDEEVLICTTNGKVTKSTYLGDRFKGSADFNKGIVYWMPLPKAPYLAYGKYNFEDDFFGAVINCAIRYACGRQSYMPSLVIGEVRKMIPMLNDKTIGCMERDIREAEKFGGYGDEKIDKPGWLAFLKELQDEMDRRKINRWT